MPCCLSPAVPYPFVSLSISELTFLLVAYLSYPHPLIYTCPSLASSRSIGPSPFPFRLRACEATAAHFALTRSYSCDYRFDFSPSPSFVLAIVLPMPAFANASLSPTPPPRAFLSTRERDFGPYHLLSIFHLNSPGGFPPTIHRPTQYFPCIDVGCSSDYLVRLDTCIFTKGDQRPCSGGVSSPHDIDPSTVWVCLVCKVLRDMSDALYFRPDVTVLII